MLKNIPKIIPPELLKILCEMGHGDEIVIADGNFPSASMGQRVVYMTGNGATEVLEAVLELFPLDTYQQPLYLMAVTPAIQSGLPSGTSIKRRRQSIPTADLRKSNALRFTSVQRKRMPSSQPVKVRFTPISF